MQHKQPGAGAVGLGLFVVGPIILFGGGGFLNWIFG